MVSPERASKSDQTLLKHCSLKINICKKQREKTVKLGSRVSF